MPARKVGWTLLELLLVLSITGIVFGLLIPVGSNVVHRQQVLLVSNQIQTAIHTARTQAWISKEPLVLAPSEPKAGWSSGMVLMRAEQAVFHWYWPKHVDVRWKGFQGQATVTFSPIIHQSTSNGYFLISKGAQIVKLTVNRLGTVCSKNIL